MNQYDDNLTEGLELPRNWKARASIQRQQPRTTVQDNFVSADTDQLQTEYAKPQTVLSRTLTTLRLVVSIMMVTATLLLLLVIWLMWPTLSLATEFTMQCNPPYVTSGCPHIQQMQQGK